MRVLKRQEDKKKSFEAWTSPILASVVTGVRTTHLVGGWGQPLWHQRDLKSTRSRSFLRLRTWGRFMIRRIKTLLTKFKSIFGASRDLRNFGTNFRSRQKDFTFHQFFANLIASDPCCCEPIIFTGPRNHSIFTRLKHPPFSQDLWEN